MSLLRRLGMDLRGPSTYLARYAGDEPQCFEHLPRGRSVVKLSGALSSRWSRQGQGFLPREKARKIDDLPKCRGGGWLIRGEERPGGPSCALSASKAGCFRAWRAIQLFYAGLSRPSSHCVHSNGCFYYKQTDKTAHLGRIGGEAISEDSGPLVRTSDGILCRTQQPWGHEGMHMDLTNEMPHSGDVECLFVDCPMQTV